MCACAGDVNVIRCVRQDLAVVFVCAGRVPKGICAFFLRLWWVDVEADCGCAGIATECVHVVQRHWARVY